MIYRYNELRKIKQYDQHIKIEEAVKTKKLFKLEKSLYSTNEYTSELEIITKLYEAAVLTGLSAYFYHGLTNVIPKYYYLDTKRKARKINDERVKQTFSMDDYFEVGKSTINYNSADINIYDKERMLIEVVRNKNNLPLDIYKEIIQNYRKKIDKINMLKVEEYLDSFKNNDNLFSVIQLEVL